MKSLLIAALVAVTLSGCVIVPARPAYYHYRAPVLFTDGASRAGPSEDAACEKDEPATRNHTH